MRKNLIEYTAFGIAMMLTLAHIAEVMFTPSFINKVGEKVSISIVDSILYAAFGLIITLIFIILKQKYWKYVFLVLILLAFSTLINFYSRTLSIGIGFVQIEFTALALLILHLGTNPGIISSFLNLFEPSERNLREREKVRLNQFEIMVKNFERKFEPKNKKQLEIIVQENKLIPEAIEAAKRLLNK